MRRPFAFAVAALFLLSLLSGCAGKKPKPQGWEAEREDVMQLLVRSAKDRETLQSRLDAVEQRLSMVEKHNLQHKSTLTSLESSVLSLKHQAAKARVPQKRKAKPKPFTARKVEKLSEKIAKIESSINEGATTPAQVVISVKNVESDAYTAAYLALKSGHYEASSKGFVQLLKEFPKGQYADQAWYWLGESYYAQQKVDEAIDAFEHIAKEFSASAKHAAALLRLGYAYQERNRDKDAISIFQRLIQEHAESAAAERARIRLRAIESEI
ncbi:MAG: tol-pal system protein YbgF [Mariprofundaceae bacterium]